MNKSEDKIKRALEKLGWIVYKPSWPDFVVYKEDGDFAFVEVKSENGKTSDHQYETFALLKRLGLPVHLIHDDEYHMTDALRISSSENLKLAKVRELRHKLLDLYDKLAHIEEEDAENLSKFETISDWKRRKNGK